VAPVAEELAAAQFFCAFCPVPRRIVRVLLRPYGDAEYLAQIFFLNELPHLLYQRMVTHAVRRHKGKIALFRRVYEFKALCLFVCKGLLHKHVLACTQKIHAYGVVQVMRKAQENGVYIVVDLLVICGYLDPLHIFCGSFGFLNIYIHKSRELAQRGQVA
jgi:hypothetical protein